MSSKARTRILSVITFILASGLIVATIQAQALDPQTAVNEPSRKEEPMAQPATEMPEHSEVQQEETVNQESIKQGKVLLESRCGSCHSVPRATTHTMTEWPESLNRMAPRSFLRDSEVKLILLYLKQELKPANSDEAESDG